MATIVLTARRILRRFSALLLIAALLIAVHALDILLYGALTERHGLIPRRLEGLDGVIAMPLLHASWSHLLANLTPLLLLGALILVFAPRSFWPATFLSVLIGGLLIWMLARPHIHIGASALVFSWFGFLVTLGVLERSWAAVIGALAAILLFGAEAIFGLRPNDPTVSWEGHMAGLAAGWIAASLLRRRTPAPRRRSFRTSR